MNSHFVLLLFYSHVSKGCHERLIMCLHDATWENEINEVNCDIEINFYLFKFT